jgi:hypothetical protein
MVVSICLVRCAYSDGVGVDGIHRSCLCIAELARRALIQESQFDSLIAGILKALQYDVRRGRASVGAHVRDSACFCIWALARAYCTQRQVFLLGMHQVLYWLLLLSHAVCCIASL